MALRALEVILVSLAVLRCGMVRAQDDDFRLFGGLGREAEVEEYRSFTDRERLRFAAKFGETEIIRITGESQIATAQEASNVAIDCLPWLLQFPGGSIQWFRLNLDEFGNPTPEGSVFNPLTRTSDTADPDQELQVIGGEFDRWLNITGVVIAQGARDPDRAIFRCEVCIGRGTPFESCYAANYTNLVIGAAPRITSESMNMCVDSGGEFNLECEVILTEPPRPIPVPRRTWTKDGDIIYSHEAGTTPNTDAFVTANPVFMAGLFNPDVLVVSPDGNIQYRTTFENTTAPQVLEDEGITEAEAREMVRSFALGTWTCTTSNNLGNDSIQVIIRMCGPLPVIPDCSVSVPGGVVFPDSGAVLSPGCAVCIQEGASITLDCTVSSGEPPIRYEWTNGTEDVVLAETPKLTVTMPGTYSCNVANLDDRTDTVASVLFFSPRAELKVGIEERTTSGCERLDLTMEERQMLGADICVFVGETLNVDCTTDDDMAILELTADGVVMANASISFIVGADDTEIVYGCRIFSVEGPCGMFQLTRNVQVFDPARISRTSDITAPPGGLTFGAGRHNDVVEVANDTLVVLQCPTSGIPEESTTWARVLVDSSDCFVETLIEDLPDDEQRNRHTVVTTPEGSTLTISPYIAFQDEGTYVCRTRNIAGNDADVVSLITNPVTPEYLVTEVSECNMMCRDGTRNQSIICHNSRFLNTIPDFECNRTMGLIRPPSMTSCAGEFPNPCFNVPVWITYPWSKCSISCNQGNRRRDVLCQIPMTGEVLPNVYCHNFVRPRTVEYCGPSTCCVTDQYPFYCKQQGAGYCNHINYQQLCCWTCGLTEIP